MKQVDIAVLLVYLLGVVALGSWFVRSSRTTERFMAAGRSLPGWAVGLSIFGTYLSSNTFIGVPGKAYAANWNVFVFSLAIPIVAVIAVRFFVPFYRRSGEISAYHHLEKRFGLWARTLAVTCYLLTQVARTGSILLGMAYGLNALLEWPVAVIIVVTGASVTLYTLLGGIEAVIWTDVAQSIILIIGAVLVALMLVLGMPEGPGQIFAVAAANPGGNKFSLGSFGASLTETTFWVVFVYGVVMNLNNFGIDQSFVQRYHTARSDREAARSVWLGALLYLPISAVFLFIGTSLFAYYQSQPDMLAEIRANVAADDLAQEGVSRDSPGYRAKLAEAAADLEPNEIGDKVLPHFIVSRLPPGMAGLVIAAIFAAAMSSIDTSLNSSATIVLADVYKRYFRPLAGERESMLVLYLATLLFGALGTGLAVALIGVSSVLDAWWLLSGIFVAGMLGVFLLGLMSRRATNAGAAIGAVCGVLVTAWVVFLIMVPESWGWPESPLHEFLIPVVGTATIIVVGLLASRFLASGRS
ncbi:MAG: sodium:solute symporter [Planctomycetes bacterium RBG_16_64_12]|nr:MAG: sodium:solute symporter [Planctomycetes bacterium RBG_16_64_12]